MGELAAGDDNRVGAQPFATDEPDEEDESPQPARGRQRNNNRRPQNNIEEEEEEEEDELATPAPQATQTRSRAARTASVRQGARRVAANQARNRFVDWQEGSSDIDFDDVEGELTQQRRGSPLLAESL